MTTVDVVSCCLQVGLWLKSIGFVKGRHASGAVLHSSREPGELTHVMTLETTSTIAIYYYSARKLILILPSHRG